MTEVGRFAVLRRLLRWAPFFFLFSRMSGPAILQNRTRQMIFSHIQQNPGAYYRSIKRDLGIAEGALAHHLQTLERERLISRQRHGTRLRFYPTTMGVPRSLTLHAWQLRALQALHASPGLSQSELARRLGLTKQALHYHIAALRRLGFVVLELVGRETRVHANEGAIGRVGTCPGCSTPYAARPGVLEFRCSVCHRSFPKTQVP